MVDKKQIKIELEAKVKKYQTGMKQAQKELDKLKKKTDEAAASGQRFRITTAGIRRSLGAMRNNLLLVSFAFGTTGAMLGKLIKAYGEQELAEKKLQAALGFTSDALLTQASALQKQTSFGDEAIIGVQALIGAFTKDEKQIAQLTETTLDLAAAKGMDLTAAADLVAKSFGSSTNALSRYGIETTGVAGSTDRLNQIVNNTAKLFGGQAKAQTDTMTGSLEQMKNAVGDAQESMGKIMAPTVKKISKHFTDAANSVSLFFQELSETSLETTLRQLKEMGVEGEKLAKLQGMVNLTRDTEILLSIDKEIEKAKSRGLLLTKNQRNEVSSILKTEDKLNKVQKGAFGMYSKTAAVVSFISDKLGRTEGATKKLLELNGQVLRVKNAEKLTSKEIEKAQKGVMSRIDKALGKGRKITANNQERIESLNKEFSFLNDILILVKKREAAEKRIAERGQKVPEKKKETEEEKQTRLTTEAFKEFVEQQEKKLKNYQQEQDFIIRLQTENKKLAADLGLLTDAQIAKNEADDKADKLRDKEEKKTADRLAKQKAEIDTIEEFTAMMAEKHIAYGLEQQLLGEWIENNKALADTMGIMTDAQRIAKEADEEKQRQDEATIDTQVEFNEMMKEKHELYDQEQEFLATWIKNNEDLAESLGIVTDATKKQQEVDEKASKARKKIVQRISKDSAEIGRLAVTDADAAKEAAISKITAYAMSAAAKQMEKLIAMVPPPFNVPVAIAGGLLVGAAVGGLSDKLRAAEHGMNEVVDEPTLILAGEAGAEHVNITPLFGGDTGGGRGGGGGITVNVSGNVLTSDFVEGELADNIRGAVRRGTDFGIG